MVRFNLNGNQLLVTAWISGDKNWFHQRTDFESFLADLALSFAMRAPRLYVFQGKWKDRIRLEAANFAAYLESSGDFAGAANKLYIHDDCSPTHSPGAKSLRSDSSQASKASDRSGQSEFRNALMNRDGSKCVFCETIDPPLEAAHVLPVEQKQLLKERANCIKFGVDSIMDSANGIILCWGCHRCFDSNLVCIDPDSGKLCIADALLSCESEKWQKLVGRVIPAGTPTWPTQALLEYRQEAMRNTTESRHVRQEKFLFYCKHCSKGYKLSRALQNHEASCHVDMLSPAAYNTPHKLPDSSGV